MLTACVAIAFVVFMAAMTSEPGPRFHPRCAWCGQSVHENANVCECCGGPRTPRKMLLGDG